MSVSIVASRDFDVTDLVRRSEVAEVPNVRRKLHQWLRMSEEVWVGLYDDKVACVWGLVPPTVISDRAHLWLLTTDIVREHKFLFVRKSQLVIEDALKRYSALVGQVQLGNRAAKRWLEWLGAEFGPPEAGFWPFIIRRKEWHPQ
jgi:hypothetical protein